MQNLGRIFHRLCRCLIFFFGPDLMQIIDDMTKITFEKLSRIIVEKCNLEYFDVIIIDKGFEFFGNVFDTFQQTRWLCPMCCTEVQDKGKTWICFLFFEFFVLAPVMVDLLLVACAIVG